MSKRSEFLKKTREKTAAELLQTAEDIRKEIELKEINRHFGQSNYNVHEIKMLRQNRARVLTLLKQQQESVVTKGAAK